MRASFPVELLGPNEAIASVAARARDLRSEQEVERRRSLNSGGVTLSHAEKVEKGVTLVTCYLRVARVSKKSFDRRNSTTSVESRHES